MTRDELRVLIRLISLVYWSTHRTNRLPLRNMELDLISLLVQGGIVSATNMATQQTGNQYINQSTYNNTGLNSEQLKK